MRPLPTSLLSASVLLLASSALPSRAKTKNCRKCLADVHIWGEMEPGKEEAFMQYAASVFTGGDYLVWTEALARKADGDLHGKAEFKRLCGTETVVDHTWYLSHFLKGQTFIHLSGDCGKAVRCRDNSKCEDSEIMG